MGIRVSCGSFDSMFYFWPALSLSEIRGGYAGGEFQRLGWCLSLVWAMWEVNLEWLNAEGRRRIKEG